jgi:hypothetical protein
MLASCMSRIADFLISALIRLSEGVSTVGRWFSLLAFLLGVAYLPQGMTWAVGMARFGAARGFFPAQYQAAVIALDISIGLVSFGIAAGLLLYKEWARKTWLIFLLALLFVHSIMISAEVMLGHKIRGSFFQWVALVLVMTLLSWVYLTKASVRSRFHNR